MLEDADGSLLVVDTGAWYVQHCPTGRIRAAHSRGGIYRVRWAAAARPDDPRGVSIDWPGSSVVQFVGLLSDPRPAVRERARRALSARGAGAITPLSDLLGSSNDATARGEAIWALAAIADPAALPPLRRALADADTDVAGAAARAPGRRGDRGAAPELARRVAAGRPRARLAAAEALSCCGDPRALFVGWEALAHSPDPILGHALTHAAHRLADAEALEVALDRPEPRVQYVACPPSQWRRHVLQSAPCGASWTDRHAIKRRTINVRESGSDGPVSSGKQRATMKSAELLAAS